jgi:hypothetical protein
VAQVVPAFEQERGVGFELAHRVGPVTEQEGTADQGRDLNQADIFWRDMRGAIVLPHQHTGERSIPLERIDHVLDVEVELDDVNVRCANWKAGRRYPA